MRTLVTALVALVIAVLWFVIIGVAARRHEADQKRRGRWDNKGPLIETEGPEQNAYGLYSAAIRMMGWRREIVGAWKRRVVRGRRPNGEL